MRSLKECKRTMCSERKRTRCPTLKRTHRRKIKYRREANGYRCCLGECHTNHLAARMIWSKVLWENIHFGKGGGGLVWCEPDDHPFLQIILVPKSKCGKYQRRPLLSLLYLSFLLYMTMTVTCWIMAYLYQGLEVDWTGLLTNPTCVVKVSQFTSVGETNHITHICTLYSTVHLVRDRVMRKVWFAN